MATSPQPPLGTEELSTQAALSARLRFNRKTVGRLLSFGGLRPAFCTHNQNWYFTKDLDRLRKDPVAEVRDKCAKLNDTERAQVLAGLINRITLGSSPQNRMRLRAGAIDRQSGTIKDAIVGSANVEALGKFVFITRDGQLTSKPDVSAKRIPAFTDHKFLVSLMEAAGRAGGVVKMRSDHDDSLAARAGFADNFHWSSDGMSVIADLHLNDSYRDREVVLETAQKTPQLIGLSIDFSVEYELKHDRALMRCLELFAADLVDAGAITHGGLFTANVTKKSK